MIHIAWFRWAKIVFFKNDRKGISFITRPEYLNLHPLKNIAGTRRKYLYAAVSLAHCSLILPDP
jgi:hypothetical protein